jgi:hypothetical protein
MVHFKTYKEFLYENENHIMGDKSELLGKKMYHGTVLEEWRPDEREYLHVTDSIPHAEYHAVSRGEGRVFSEYSRNMGKPCTAIIYEITIDEDIIKLEWVVDDDCGIRSWMKTWVDSFNEVGTFVIMGNYDVSKFKVIYEEVITPESKIRYL